MKYLIAIGVASHIISQVLEQAKIPQEEVIVIDTEEVLEQYKEQMMEQRRAALEDTLPYPYNRRYIIPDIVYEPLVDIQEHKEKSYLPFRNKFNKRNTAQQRKIHRTRNNCS